jgi:hypothetical protein
VMAVGEGSRPAIWITMNERWRLARQRYFQRAQRKRVSAAICSERIDSGTQPDQTERGAHSLAFEVEPTEQSCTAWRTALMASGLNVIPHPALPAAFARSRSAGRSRPCSEKTGSNPEERLYPGMYAEVSLERYLNEARARQSLVWGF